MPRRQGLILAALVFGANVSPIRAAPLRVGIDLDGEPMTFVDAKGVPEGFAVEIMNGIAREMGFEIVYVARPWAEMLADFRAGRTDALANITYTNPRSAFIEFSVPNIVMNGALFVRKDDHSIKTLSDLRDHRVAVKLGGAPDEYLVSHGWAQHVVPSETLRDSLRAVTEGRADVALDARIIGLKDIRDEHLANLEVADIALFDFAQRLHIGLHPGDTVRLAQVNEGLARLHADGSYDRIYEKWIDPLDPRRLSFQQLQPYVIPAAAVLTVIFGAFVWQRRLLTDLKQAQAMQARQEAQFRFIYEHTPVGLSWLRHEKAETRLVNAAHERITGVPAHRSYDTRNYVAATFPADREAQLILQEQLYRGVIDHFSLEKRYLHADGAVIWAVLSMHLYRDPVTGEGQEITTLVDITDLKRMAEERQQLDLKILETQKLESLGVLAGGIAHDFNNLLTVIIANASFLRVADDDLRDRAERLEAIETAGHRAADLCRQMLAYAGKGRFVVQRVGLSGLVRETADLLQVSISKKARLIVTLAEDLPEVEADASQIQQVVMNLVINASDSLGDSAGEIRLTTRRGRPELTPNGLIHSFDLPPGDCACLEVADSGCGMEPETLARIFDPFFTTKFVGRGLGLAAVLGIVRACRGALTVDSVPLEGTTFRLYLPSAVAPPAGPAIAPSGPRAEAAPPRGTILVADDEPAVLATATHLLRHQGYQVVAAADGLEAVSKFQANPTGFAAVLLDLTMPGLNGAEVLREIRTLNPAVRVLIMSGFSEPDVLDRLSGLGPVQILHKPFTREMLLSRLAEIAAG